MKQTFILWLSAALLTILTGYFESVTNPGSPVSGTIGVDGKKVSYYFKTLYSPKDRFPVLIKSDQAGIAGTVEWKNAFNDAEWNEISLKDSNSILSATLPSVKPLDNITYRVKITNGSNQYFLPQSSYVIARCVGNVPIAIKILFTISLFGGLIFSLRTGFEYFRNGQNEKKLALLTFVFFFINAIVLTPLKKALEAGVLGHGFLQVHKMFDPAASLIFFLWIITIVIIFNFKKVKALPLVTAIISLLVFAFIH